MLVKSSFTARRLAFQSGAASPLLLGKAVIALLLVVWIAASLSGVFARLLPQPDLNEAAISPSALTTRSTQTAAGSALDIVALKGIKLFGDTVQPAPVEEVVEEPVNEEAVETKLNLELVGSFASDDQGRAYAIIANGKKQLLYRVDEDIEGFNNVKLKQVFADKVILDNRGKQEVLHMYPDGKPITSSNFAPAASSRRNRGGNTAAQALSGLSESQKLEKISDAIRFSRKTRDGKMVGFRVLPGRNRAAFEQTGLELNDVVTAIDGQTLDNLKAANKVYQEKRNATQANLTVLRGDEELTIDIDLNNININ